MLYRKQTFAPRAFHSELQKQMNTVNTQKSPPWACDKGWAEACAERFSALNLGPQPSFCVLYMKIKKQLADYESQKNNSGLKQYSCSMPLLHKKLSVIVFWLTFTQLLVIRWLTDWLVADLLTDLLTSLLTNLLTNWLADWLTDWLWLINCLTFWLAHWLIDLTG